MTIEEIQIGKIYRMNRNPETMRFVSDIGVHIRPKQLRQHWPATEIGLLYRQDGKYGTESLARFADQASAPVT